LDGMILPLVDDGREHGVELNLAKPLRQDD
jgi:hypothetical protein